MPWTQRDIPQKFDYSKSSQPLYVTKHKTKELNLCQIAENFS